MDLTFLGIYTDIGFDLGSANTLICTSNGGVTLSEPSVVAIDKTTKKVLAVGSAADEMLGRTPDNILAVCPVRGGVIADFEATASMVKAFLKRVSGKLPIIKPRVSLSVPCGITDVERRAAIEAFLAAGARSVLLIEEPMACALGLGLNAEAPEGTMVVNIGAGTTEAAVLSLGGIVTARSERVGGASIDNAILSYIRRQYGVTIGAKTAEELKIEIASAADGLVSGSYDVKGRETSTGLPKNIRVNADEIKKATADIITTIVNTVLDTLEETPPELAADILSKGIVLTGGGALMKGIDEVIEKASGIRTVIADKPKEAACIGARLALSNPTVIRRSEVARKR